MPPVSKKPASCLKKPSCKKTGVKVRPAASLEQAPKNAAKKPSMEEVKDDDEITLILGEQKGAEDGEPPMVVQPPSQLLSVQPTMDGEGGPENLDSQSPVTNQPVDSPPLELPSSSYYHDVASARFYHYFF